nr:Cna B-type domain-containing protein [Collinsella urealyticum]
MTKDKPIVKSSNLGWMFLYTPVEEVFSDVVIKDVLDENITISLNAQGEVDLSNFKITAYTTMRDDGTYEMMEENTSFVAKPVAGKPGQDEVGVRYDPADYCIYFTLPDTPAGKKPLKYRVMYDTGILLVNPQATSITNHVEVWAGATRPGAAGEGSLRIADYAAFAQISGRPYVVIKKVDTEGTPLAGAVFSCNDADGTVIHAVSDSKGIVYFSNLAPDVVEIKEVKAPDACIQLTEAIRIDVSDAAHSVLAAPEGTSGTGSFTDPLVVPNAAVKKTDIQVVKRWVDKDNRFNKRPDSVVVRLLANGEPTDHSLVLSEEHGWTDVFSDLPLVDAAGKDLVYTVSEEVPAGYTSAVEGDMATGFTLTNTLKPIPGKPGEPEKTKKKRKKHTNRLAATGDANRSLIQGMLAAGALTMAAGAVLVVRRRSGAEL